MAKLGEVCDILNGYAFKSNQYTTSGVRIIRISNVQKGYIEDKSPVYYPCDDENVKKYELKQNDLLISLTGNVGRTALLEEKFLPAALNQRVSCVRLKEPDKVLKTYLFHLLNSDYFEQQCMKAAEGVAQKNLSPKWLFEYKIPIYSIERQKEISNTLDKIDLLIILRKQQLIAYDATIYPVTVVLESDIANQLPQYGNGYIYSFKSRKDFQVFFVDVINSDKAVTILQQLINLAGNAMHLEMNEEAETNDGV